MTMLLRQSTNIDIGLGPFVDAADGFTPETTLTISQADVRLKKAAANWAQKNQSSTATHEENGWYEVSLNAADTNTLGSLLVAVNESGARPVFREFLVVPANVFDSWVSGTDQLQVHTNEITAGLIVAATFGSGAIDAAAVAADAANEIADALLKRDWTAVTGEAARSMLNALRFLRNKWSISGSTLTVTTEDDTTTAWQATLSSSSAAEPITGSDPT